MQPRNVNPRVFGRLLASITLGALSLLGMQPPARAWPRKKKYEPIYSPADKLPFPPPPKHEVFVHEYYGIPNWRERLHPHGRNNYVDRSQGSRFAKLLSPDLIASVSDAQKPLVDSAANLLALIDSRELGLGRWQDQLRENDKKRDLKFETHLFMNGVLPFWLTPDIVLVSDEHGEDGYVPSYNLRVGEHQKGGPHQFPLNDLTDPRSLTGLVTLGEVLRDHRLDSSGVSRVLREAVLKEYVKRMAQANPPIGWNTEKLKRGESIEVRIIKRSGGTLSIFMDNEEHELPDSVLKNVDYAIKSDEIVDALRWRFVLSSERGLSFPQLDIMP